jgi:hypothetical protein
MKLFKKEVNVPLETLQAMFGGEIQGDALILPEPELQKQPQWEYYYRRFNRVYLRDGDLRAVLDLSENTKWPFKYGQKVGVNFKGFN